MAQPLDLRATDGRVTGSVTLDEEMFGIEPNVPVLHQVVTAQLAAGKKHVAIFYGAGHLPDMGERLVKDFKLQRTSERWLTAWNLARAGGKQPAAAAPAR